MIRTSYLLAALVVAVTGCATLNPTIGQLDRLKALAAGGQYQAIAKENIDCEPSQPGCAQSHWIKGDACYRLAAGSLPHPPGGSGTGTAVGPTDAKRQQLDCAITSYDATLAAL